MKKNNDDEQFRVPSPFDGKRLPPPGKRDPYRARDALLARLQQLGYLAVTFQIELAEYLSMEREDTLRTQTLEQVQRLLRTFPGEGNLWHMTALTPCSNVSPDQVDFVAACEQYLTDVIKRTGSLGHGEE